MSAFYKKTPRGGMFFLRFGYRVALDTDVYYVYNNIIS